MQVMLEQQDDSNVVLDITVPRGEVDREINALALRLKDKANVNGFRKGQAPVDLIKRQYADLLRAEASTRLIQSGVIDGLKQKQLKNIGNPVLLEEFRPTETKKYPGKFKLDGSFNFKISVMLPPNIDVKDYVGLEVSVDTNSFSKWFSKQIRKQQLLFGDKTTVARPAQTGDQILADFEGFVDGQPLATSREESVSVVIGEESLIKELEDVFIGKTEGEDFETTVAFPSNYGVPALAGKNVTFKCKLKEVVELKPHELNDSLAALLSFDSVDALMSEYQKKWETEYESVIKTQIFADIMDQLIDSTKLEVPDSWVEQELKMVASRLQIRPQDVLTNHALRQQLIPIAEKTVKSAYIMDKIYEKEESLRLSFDDINEFASQVAVQQSVGVTELLERLRAQGMYEGFITQCEHRKVMNFLVASANIKEKV